MEIGRRSLLPAAGSAGLREDQRPELKMVCAISRPLLSGVPWVRWGVRQNFRLGFRFG